MDKPIMELLETVSGADLLFAVLLIIGILILYFTQKDKIMKHLNKWREETNEEEDFHSLVYSLKDSIEQLGKEVRQNREDRDKELLQYRDDSRKIRDDMYKVMNSQSQDIKSLTKTVEKMEERNSKTKRAELKEKIERIYRECHPSMKCTDTQLEALKELIEEYEEHGGVNSFVHSLVESEMYTWEVIKRLGSDEVE